MLLCSRSSCSNGRAQPPQVLTATAVRALAKHLPDTVASSDWVSLYSNVRHGSSLKTLLARCAGWQPTLVLVEACAAPAPGGSGGRSSSAGHSRKSSDGRAAGAVRLYAEDAAAAATVVSGADEREGGGAGDNIHAGGDTDAADEAAAGAVTFGGFASGSTWKNMGRSFAGDGSSFLFTFGGGADAEEQSWSEKRRSQGGGGGGEGSSGGEAGLRVFPWARKNRSFMTSDDGVGLGMGGGGGGSFGFLLSADLRTGSTGRCETFENCPLVGAEGSHGGVGGFPAEIGEEGAGTMFDVLSVEVWGFRAAKGPGLLTRIAL